MKVQKIILMAIAVFLPLLSVISCEDPLPESIPVTAVTLNSASMELVEGESQMLTAVVSPSNADNQKVIWMSSNSSVASVADGKVTALKPGKATITVKTDDGGRTATCEVTVNAKVYPVESVSLDRTSAELTEGDELTLAATVKPDNATDKSVVWSSSNSSVASVTEGKVTALKPGSATITVKTVDGGKTATCEVTVKARPKAEMLKIEFTNTSGSIGGDLYINGEYHFSVSAVPEDAFAEYEWSIEDEKIATISGNNNTAKIQTKDYGRTAVIVTDKISGISERYDFSTCVTNFKFTEESDETSYGLPVLTLTVGEQHQISCSYSPASATGIFRYLESFKFREIYEPINTYVIVKEPSTVDIDENGVLTAKKVGTTMMETMGSGVYEYPNGSSGVFIRVKEKYIPVTGISLNSTSATLTEGDKLTLTATVNPDNATNKNVTWSSSNSSVATVTNGKVTALKAGKTTITVKTEDGGKTATCEVTVKAMVFPVTSVSLDKTSVEMTEGDEFTLTTTVNPDNATNKNVTWSSSNSSVASVTNGKVIALKAGKTTITVKTEDGGKTATCEVKVTDNGSDSNNEGVGDNNGNW